jgi:hypothetical protein
MCCTRGDCFQPSICDYGRATCSCFVTFKPSQNSMSLEAALVNFPACAGDRVSPHLVIHFPVTGSCDMVGVMFQMFAYNRRIYLVVMLPVWARGVSTSLKCVAQHVAPCSVSTLTSSKSEVCILAGVVKYCRTFASFSSPTAGLLPLLLRRGRSISTGITPRARSRSLFHSCSGRGGKTLSKVAAQWRSVIDRRSFNGRGRPHIFVAGIFGLTLRITAPATSAG